MKILEKQTIGLIFNVKRITELEKVLKEFKARINFVQEEHDILLPSFLSEALVVSRIKYTHVYAIDRQSIKVDGVRFVRSADIVYLLEYDDCQVVKEYYKGLCSYHKTPFVVLAGKKNEIWKQPTRGN